MEFTQAQLHAVEANWIASPVNHARASARVQTPDFAVQLPKLVDSSVTESVDR
jgi:hypothetical protein